MATTIPEEDFTLYWFAGDGTHAYYGLGKFMLRGIQVYPRRLGLKRWDRITKHDITSWVLDAIIADELYADGLRRTVLGG